MASRATGNGRNFSKTFPMIGTPGRSALPAKAVKPAATPASAGSNISNVSASFLVSGITLAIPFRALSALVYITSKPFMASVIFLTKSVIGCVSFVKTACKAPNTAWNVLFFSTAFVKAFSKS